MATYQPSADEIQARLNKNTEVEMRSGLRFGIGIIVVVNLAFIAERFFAQGDSDPTHFAFQTLQLVGLLLVYLLTLRQPRWIGTTALAAATVSWVYVTTAAAGVVVGEYAAPRLLFGAFAISSAALLPWGVAPQALTSLVGMGAVLTNVYVVLGGFADESGYDPLIAVAAGMAGAVVVAWQLERQRVKQIANELRREHAEAELRRLNATLERRVDERTSALEAANRELESFSYAVSHDLRQPLRSVNGFTQTLREDFGDKIGERGLHYTNNVLAAVARMDKLITGLLELGRIGRRSLQPEHVNMTEVASGVLEELRREDGEREIEIEVDPELRAEGDPELLRIVAQNLIGNAWKYTRSTAAARIEIGKTEKDDRTVYFVRDDGVGFDMTEADALFTPFKRLRDAEGFPGSGVGLATVQRIINRHGGHIWAEAEPAAGATFYFTLD